MGDQFATSGPHIGTTETVSKSMADVMFALAPAFVASVVLFGPYSIYLVLATAVFSTIFEAIFQPGKFSKQRPFGDWSAFGAGYILGLTLAPGSPWWTPVLGAFLLVAIGKHAFGGLGNNIFNPALVARGILLIGWPATITEWHTPFAFWQSGAVDVFTGPTPLVSTNWGYLELFLGNIPGSIGETSAIALILGAVYLHLRGHRLHRIALGTLIGTFLTAAALGTDPLAALLSGSIIFTALYMATDFVTSPMGRTPHWIFGLGIGVLTVVIREFGIYPEGSTFAVLIMNGCVYLIDKVAADPKFGEVRERTFRYSSVGAFALGSVLFVALATGGVLAWQSTDASYVSGQVRRDMRTFFPQGAYAVRMDVEVDNIRAERIHTADEQTAGYLVYAQADGYNGPIRVVAAIDSDYEIDGVRVYHHTESGTLGTRINERSFLQQFLGLHPDNRSQATEELDTISGATVSSRATARAVESALGFLDEPEEEVVDELEDLEDGTFTGSGSGYADAIELEVTVQDGRITEMEVIDHSETRQIFDGAWDTLREQIIERQTTEVDTISGATGSSRGIIEAVEDALNR